jgi:hypothetical protein
MFFPKQPLFSLYLSGVDLKMNGFARWCQRQQFQFDRAAAADVCLSSSLFLLLSLSPLLPPIPTNQPNWKLIMGSGHERSL